MAKEGYQRVADDEPEALLLEEYDDGDEDEDPQTELERLNLDIATCTEQEKTLEKRLDCLNGFWEPRAHALQKYMKATVVKRNLAQEKADCIENAEGEVQITGLKSLSWVRNPRFVALCSAVVVTNLITMFMEMLHPHYKHDFWLLDQLILVFYVVELTLKALLYQRELLCGRDLWWNWLDTIIVFAAILDQWVQPLIVAVAGDVGGKHSTVVQIIKWLRVLRMARILKTVRAFMQSDLSWTEGKHFQLFIMGTIAANSLIMSFESDYPDFFGWFYVEQILLCIFSFELLVRLRFAGFKFFYDKHDFAWNWLDFVIVCGGIVDEWMMPLITLAQKLAGVQHTAKLDVGEITQTLRMARLLRILRLVRLVKNVPPLFTLIVGILQAMQGMAWVLVLTAVFLYAFALLGVRLIGHGLLFGGRAPDEVAAIFPSVPQSMFVLFKVMNGDTDMVEPLFEALPLSKLVCVLYMVVSSWAILSILTAVVSENMINATDAHRLEVDGEASINEEREARQFLHDALSKADKNADGDLGWEEFQELLEDEPTLQLLNEVTSCSKEDLQEVYTCLRTSDRVKREDFITALRTEKRSVTERWMFRLEKKMINLQNAFDKELGNIKPASSPQAPSTMSLDAKSLELIIEPLLAKFDERLERRTREMADLLAANLLKERCQVVDREVLSRPDLSKTSDLESSLARIEEQVDMNSQLLNRSRTECTIVAGLAKLEKQHMDIKKLLYERSGEDWATRSALTRIEEQLDNGKGLALREIGAELSALESGLQRIDKQLGSSQQLQAYNNQSNEQHQHGGHGQVPAIRQQSQDGLFLATDAQGPFNTAKFGDGS